MTLTRWPPSNIVQNHKFRRWILFDIFFISNLITYFYHPAYNVPTCLAKVSESKLSPNDRVSVDSPDFETKMKQIFTFLALTNWFQVRKKRHSSSYVQFLMGIGCTGSNLHWSSIKMSFTNLLDAIRPLEWEKMSFFCSKGNTQTTLSVSRAFLQEAYLRSAWSKFFQTLPSCYMVPVVQPGKGAYARRIALFRYDSNNMALYASIWGIILTLARALPKWL